MGLSLIHIWQTQLLALAGAVSLRPEVLILDEPIAQLDPAHADRIYQVLRELNEKHGKTILVIEHHTEYIAAVSYTHLRRTVEPYDLIFQWAGWYLWGWCRTREDFRLFKMNRMTELELSGSFEKRPAPLPDLSQEKEMCIRDRSWDVPAKRIRVWERIF